MDMCLTCVKNVFHLILWQKYPTVKQYIICSLSLIRQLREGIGRFRELLTAVESRFTQNLRQVCTHNSHFVYLLEHNYRTKNSRKFPFHLWHRKHELPSGYELVTTIMLDAVDYISSSISKILYSVM